MVSVRQLELNLEVALEEASEVPENANVLSLWSQFADELAGLDHRDQLRVAGNVLVKLAGLCEAKADLLWEDWQDAHNADGPVMGEGWLSGLTRQTQELDFSELVSRSYEKRTGSEEGVEPEESLAGDADKANVIAMLDAIEENELKEQALLVSHSENISEWVKALADQQMDSPRRLVELQKQLQIPMVEIWIAALLGGFVLEQRGSFYQRGTASGAM